MDQWSYYQDGFEVYRDVDYNDDRKIDESRWLNTAGTGLFIVVNDGREAATWP